MKRPFTWIMVTVIALGVAGCLGAIRSYRKDPPLAKYDGRLRVPGLRGEVNVYRDGFGVPHIFSEDEHDLFFAAGYVQAQDRLWEMVLLRATAQGRLSEILGDMNIPGMGMRTITLDKRQRIMGMKWLGEAGEPLLEEVNPEVYAQIDAYCQGVNAFISGHKQWKDLPVEFQVLRVRPEPFRPADIISFGRFIGSMLCGNMDEELLRYSLIKKYGEDTGWEFAPLHIAHGPTIVPPQLLHNKLDHPRDLPPGGRPAREEVGYSLPLTARQATELMLAETAIKKAIYQRYPMASNNWVVSPKLTESGNAMLCNDPHLSHNEPSLFYMMRLKGAGFDSYGVTFPGNPYIVLGHTRKLSWGATTSIADVQDLFVETTDRDHEGMYKYRGEWVPFTVREEVIRVRVGSGFIKKKIKIKQSVHGPIINEIAGELAEDMPPIALRWTGWDFDRNQAVFKALVGSRTVEEFMERFKKIPKDELGVMNIAMMYNVLMKGDSIKDFVKAMDLIVLPNQSWVAADADGHIAYLPGGLVPLRNKGIGVTPAPGESGEFDWTGFIPTMELPHAIDPDRGYMATANNEVVDAEWYPYIFGTNYGEGWRAARIEQLIKELAPLSMQDMRKIQNDVFMKQAEWEVPIILSAVEEKGAADPMAKRASLELKQWDYLADLDATAPIIFFTFTKKLRPAVMKDEFPEDEYEKYFDGGHVDVVINKWLDEGGSEYFDDKRTPEIEDMNDIIVRTLAESMREVIERYGDDPREWEWGKHHTIKWVHYLGFGPLKDLSVGPFPHLGARHTVRNAGHSGGPDNPWRTGGGPVLRHIMDMGKPDQALMVIDGSQSGQWLSPHYRDMHKLWLNSEYVTAVMDPQEARQNASYHLVLEP